MKSDLAPLSGLKRRLLQQYLGRDLRTPPAEQPLPRTRKLGAPALAGGRRQFARLRELSLEDYPRVAALESQYGLGLRSYNHWSHSWLGNPAYEQLRKNWPIGWVLENENREIVGSHENIPRLYEFRNTSIIAAVGRGMVVDSRYRGYALWLLMAFYQQRNAELCIDNTAGDETSPDSEAVGALRVPVGAWDRSDFWITNYHGSVSIWLKRNMPRKMWPLVDLLCYPLAAAFFLKDTLARSALRRVRSGLVLECCVTFDGRFDEFWEDLKRENPDLLLAVRTREVLQWHFAYALLQKRLWIWTIRQDSRIGAYAIFLKTEDPKSGFARVALVDFQVLGGNTSLLLPMVSAALERCRRERVYLLENVGLAFEKSGISNLAPYQRRGSPWRFFYKARDKDLAEVLNNPRVWAPSLYDGDASIL